MEGSKMQRLQLNNQTQAQINNMIYVNEVKVGDMLKFNPPSNSLEISESTLKQGDTLEICEVNKGNWISEKASQKLFCQSFIKTARIGEQSIDVFLGEQGFSYLEKI